MKIFIIYIYLSYFHFNEILFNYPFPMDVTLTLSNLCFWNMHLEVFLNCNGWEFYEIYLYIQANPIKMVKFASLEMVLFHKSNIWFQCSGIGLPAPTILSYFQWMILLFVHQPHFFPWLCTLFVDPLQYIDAIHHCYNTTFCMNYNVF